MDTQQKLEVLADASRFDLSCACGTREHDDHRRRAPGGTWLYPASLPRGGTSIILKTLLSSSCLSDCAYCPLRAGRDAPRCTHGFGAEEIPFEAGGNLSLAADPKELWAERHPGFFPLDVNRAEEFELLRVPGFGPVTVGRILELRRNGGKVAP